VRPGSQIFDAEAPKTEISLTSSRTSSPSNCTLTDPGRLIISKPIVYAPFGTQNKNQHLRGRRLDAAIYRNRRRSSTDVRRAGNSAPLMT